MAANHNEHRRPNGGNLTRRTTIDAKFIGTIYRPPLSPITVSTALQPTRLHPVDTHHETNQAPINLPQQISSHQRPCCQTGHPVETEHSSRSNKKHYVVSPNLSTIRVQIYTNKLVTHIHTKQQTKQQRIQKHNSHNNTKNRTAKYTNRHQSDTRRQTITQPLNPPYAKKSEIKTPTKFDK